MANHGRLLELTRHHSPRFPDRLCDRRDVVDEAVIATGDGDEARAGLQPAGCVPPPPRVADALVGHALVLVPHHDRHRDRRRIAVDVDLRHLLEEAAVNRELAIRAMVEEADRIARRELLGPAGSEAEGGGDQDERGADTATRGLEGDEGAQRASDDDGRVCCGGGAHGFVGHGVEVEPLEGGAVQVRGEEFDPLRSEGLAQQRNLPPRGGRREAV